MSLTRRLPKVGFTNIFKKQYSVVNVADLNKLDENTVVDINLLKELGVISKIEKDGLKVLGNGELTKPLTVKANKFSESAINKIKQAGGTLEVL